MKTEIINTKPGLLHLGLNTYNINSIKEIKINGIINEKDLMTLSLLAIESIDLSGAIYKGVADFLFTSGFIHIRRIELPEGIPEITDKSFYYSKSLQLITLPKSIAKIGENCFQECNELEYLKINVNNKNYKDLNNIIYNKSLSELIRCPKGIKGDITTSKELVEIKANAFTGCKKIRQIQMGQNVKVIKDNAFSNCINLQEIKFSENISTIGDYAVTNCEKISSIKIPEKTISIGFKCFEKCTSLQKIIINEKLQGIKNSLDKCPSLKSIIINNNNNYLTIRDGILYSKNLDQLIKCPAQHEKDVLINNKTTIIKENAFSECIKIKDIVCQEGIVQIENGAFSKNLCLKRIILPKSIAKIGDRTFDNCPFIKEIICYATNPPMCQKNTFLYVNIDDCLVRVPKKSIKNYLRDKEWNKFKHITSIEE